MVPLFLSGDAGGGANTLNELDNVLIGNNSIYIGDFSRLDGWF